MSAVVSTEHPLPAALGCGTPRSSLSLGVQPRGTRTALGLSPASWGWRGGRWGAVSRGFLSPPILSSPPDGHLPHRLGGGAGPAHQAGAPHHQGPRPRFREVPADPPAHPAEGEAQPRDPQPAAPCPAAFLCQNTRRGGSVGGSGSPGLCEDAEDPSLLPTPGKG